MAKGKGSHRKWSDEELMIAYDLMINQRVSIDEMVLRSRYGRTASAIITKFFKTYGTSVRTGSDGKMYLYLDEDVPKKIVRNRTNTMKELEDDRAMKSDDVVQSEIREYYKELWGIEPDEDKTMDIDYDAVDRFRSKMMSTPNDDEERIKNKLLELQIELTECESRGRELRGQIEALIYEFRGISF